MSGDGNIPEFKVNEKYTRKKSFEVHDYKVYKTYWIQHEYSLMPPGLHRLTFGSVVGDWAGYQAIARLCLMDEGLEFMGFTDYFFSGGRIIRVM